MTHNHYKLNEDLLRPLANFFHENNIHGMELGAVFSTMKFNEDIYSP
jgi:hypothetical protein